MKMKRLVKCVVFTVFLLLAGAALAQIDTNLPPGTNGPPVTPGAGSGVNLIAVWNAAIVGLVPALIALIKKWRPSIPSIAWPIVAPLLGVAANWLAAKAGLLPDSFWALGALCGAGGVGLREVINQITKLGGDSTPPPAPGTG